MKINVRIAALTAALSLYGAASAGAQQADTAKPGGLNKVAHDISKTSKKAGRDTKAEMKRAGSKEHNTLTDAGNETKTVVKKTTRIKGSQSHQPGGLNTVGRYMADKKAGDKIFSDLFTLKSDVGNPILRQTPIMNDNRPAKAVTWIDKGILTSVGPNQGATPNMSLSQEGSNLSIADMIKQTRRGLLVTFFWYIRGVPSDDQPLLNTGMTRDGLFLIENGEISGPVQNFRWNMSPLVGYNNLTLVGKPVPIHTGESYDGGGTALVPPVRIEEFYMTSVSPAV